MVNVRSSLLALLAKNVNVPVPVFVSVPVLFFVLVFVFVLKSADNFQRSNFAAI